MPEEFVTAVEGDVVVVRYGDPEHHAQCVTLWTDLELGDTTFTSVDQGWELRLTDLPVDRLEYLVSVDDDMRLDAGNPRVVPGAFGDHSWLPLPGYVEPDWLGLDEIDAERAPLTLSRTAVGRFDADLWSPADAAAEEMLPLLISHDGPEMDAYGRLTSYVGAMVGAGRLPPMRVALLSPGNRIKRYAASPAYARALTNRMIPALTDAVPTRGKPVLIGQSLGAVAALHAAWRSPGTFAGLLLQSGSFFTAELDPQESGFERWAEVTGFVAELARAERADLPPTTITCGTAEENHANNRALLDQLTRLDVAPAWGERRDGHTWTCWRDSLDPHLTSLLAQAWA